MLENSVHQPAERRGSRQPGPIARQIDPGEHHLAIAMADQVADLIDHRAHRHRARMAPPERYDAKSTAVITPVLDLNEGPKAFGEAVDQMPGGGLHRHDVVHRDLGLELVPRRCRQRSYCSPRSEQGLGVIADDAIDLGHLRECERLGLRRAAGHHDLRLRPLAP